MIIAIDFNNTIQDQIKEIIEWAFASTGILLAQEDFGKWDPEIGCKVEMSEPEFVDFAWKNELLQMAAKPFAGVKEAIDQLIEAGHEIIIVTSTCLSPLKVLAWLDKWDINFNKIYFTKDKADVGFDILIDDSPIVINQMLEEKKSILKFNIPWNEGLSCPGFFNWNDLVNFILITYSTEKNNESNMCLVSS